MKATLLPTPKPLFTVHGKWKKEPRSWRWNCLTRLQGREEEIFITGDN